MKQPPSDERLGGVLADWRISPRRNPGFRALVQARIGEAPSWRDYAHRHAVLVAGALALAVVAGALTGAERARSRTEADRAALAAAYVHALDGRWMRGP